MILSQEQVIAILVLILVVSNILMWFIYEYTTSKHKKELEKNYAKESENIKLKRELLKRGNIFFVENKWLGYDYTVYGVVVEGEVIEIKKVINGQYVK